VGKILLAGVGGFLGSILRYLVSGLVQDSSRSIHFPYGTLTVNLIGCFAIGLLAQLAETRGFFTAETRTLVFVGVLGGFTTFSAFGNETINLWREGQSGLALMNIAAHLLLCLGAVWLSRALAIKSEIRSANCYVAICLGYAMMLPEEGYLSHLYRRERPPRRQLLHEWIVMKAREEGLAGATAIRAMMALVRTAACTFKIERLSQDLPIIVEIVDARQA
jgi:CrcB protein